jgi:hypothetical protein
MSNLSLLESRLGVNKVLTNLAQGTVQPAFVMRNLFPLVDVSEYGGQLIEFDSSDYDDVDDDRADDSEYNEVESGYFGRPFTLQTKGLRYRVGDKKAKQMSANQISWSNVAASSLMNRAMLRHEVEASVLATDPTRYSTDNRQTLSPGAQIGDTNVDADMLIREGMAAVSGQVGLDPNVICFGRDVWDVMCNRYSQNFVSVATAPGMRLQLTPERFGEIYGFDKVVVCNAIRKVGGEPRRVFGKHIVMARVHSAALGAERTPWKTTGQITIFEPSFGYTYVYQGNPLLFDPYRDEDRGATVYKMDFDRRVVNTGVDKNTGLITHGYLIHSAVA